MVLLSSPPRLLPFWNWPGSSRRLTSRCRLTSSHPLSKNTSSREHSLRLPESTRPSCVSNMACHGAPKGERRSVQHGDYQLFSQCPPNMWQPTFCCNRRKNLFSNSRPAHTWPDTWQDANLYPFLLPPVLAPRSRRRIPFTRERTCVRVSSVVRVVKVVVVAASLWSSRVAWLISVHGMLMIHVVKLLFFFEVKMVLRPVDWERNSL